MVYLLPISLDPYRWLISYRKPATLSSTEGELYASFATDGNFKTIYTEDPGTNYSATLLESTPTLQIDLEMSVPVFRIHIKGIEYNGFDPGQTYLTVRVGDNPTVGSTENPQCGSTMSVNKWQRMTCGKKGRYVNVIRAVPNSGSQFKLVEVAVLKKPLGD
ncbi:Hypothetical predicted protein [Paramuricea clavata]|uniref:Uncharacterized protein n=1 Tax=Paramuricea clavata TaxID=317549 RepID=A0A7D9K5S8_PARCT|nr:Hypothetical predicted protein [Paramuricea clavata]